jgi:hypothetical protein
LGSLEAYRYGSLRVTGTAGPIRVYAAANSGGAATVICSPASLIGCDRVAAGMLLHGVKPFGLGPDPAYAAAVSRPLATLRTGQAAGQRAYSTAKTPVRQAMAAAALATAYRTAASALRRADPPPQDRSAHQALVVGVAGISSAYGSLASAARREDRAAYRQATTALRRSQSVIEGALRQLAHRGYKLA